MTHDESRLTKTSMIRGAQSDDASLREDAWIRMTSMFGPIIHNQVRRSGVGTSEIADVVQTVFFKASKSIDNYHHNRDKHGSFRAWLYGIANHSIHDYFRKSAKTPLAIGGTESSMIEELSVEDSAGPDWEPDPDLVNSKTTFAHQVVAVIQRDFSPSTWQCFWRTVVQGESAANIGEDLSLSATAVRQAKFRVLKRLREELDAS